MPALASIEISRSVRMVIPANGSKEKPFVGPTPRLPLRDRDDLEPLLMVERLPNAGERVAFGVLC